MVAVQDFGFGQVVQQLFAIEQLQAAIQRFLGIPAGRDEHLPYRFVDAAFARHCTRNPLRRGQLEGRDYQRLTVEEYLHA